MLNRLRCCRLSEQLLRKIYCVRAPFVAQSKNFVGTVVADPL